MLSGVGCELPQQLVWGHDARDHGRRAAQDIRQALVVSYTPSLGKTVRHWLNRGGDRAANSAIHIIAIGRLGLDPRSQDYVAKRIAAGHSRLEAIRCLKRYMPAKSSASS